MDAVLWLIFALASIMAAEAPRLQCNVEARIAVVHVALNRLGQPWVHEVTQGWQTRQPVAQDITDVLLALAQPDITAGALFLFGPGDIARLRQQHNGALPWWLRRYHPYRRWECGSTYVEAWTMNTNEQPRWAVRVVASIEDPGTMKPIEAAMKFVEQNYPNDERPQVKLALIEHDHPLAGYGFYKMDIQASHDAGRLYLLSPPWAMIMRKRGYYLVLEFIPDAVGEDT